MGWMQHGVWLDNPPPLSTDDGSFRRPETVFRDSITEGGRFAPEPGRYHLYVSLACP